MNERGRRLDECLDILDAFWTTSPVEYHGRFWTTPATYADLKPAQRPRPPTYLAGFTSAAKRRIARRADGWLPTVVVPGQLRPSAIAGTMAELREAARQAGRDPDALGMVLRINPLAGTRLADIVDVITGARMRRASTTPSSSSCTRPMMWTGPSTYVNASWTAAAPYEPLWVLGAEAGTSISRLHRDEAVVACRRERGPDMRRGYR